MRNENGYGCISKLSGRRRRPYVVKITTGYKIVDGKARQIQKTLGYFATKKEASIFLAEFHQGKAAPLIGKPIMTWEQVYEAWYKEKESLVKKPGAKTFAKYETSYKKTARLATYRFVDVRAEDLQAIMDAGKHLTRSPQASLLQLMKSMYNWAINHDVCTTNYADRVILQYTDDVVREHKPFTDEEIYQLIEADAAFPLLLIFSGMRIGEVLELTHDRIHDGYIIGGLKTAAGRDRFIPVAGPILKYVRPQGQRYYFDTAGGKAWTSANYIAQRWKPLMEELGMDHHPHDARHTCATLMERAEIPLLHRKLILGHAVDDITEGRYTHVSREALAADMEKVAALFFS